MVAKDGAIQYGAQAYYRGQAINSPIERKGNRNGGWN
jgi:hypothetical protein